MDQGNKNTIVSKRTEMENNHRIKNKNSQEAYHYSKKRKRNARKS